MSLNFYADIDNFKVDSKGNVSITVKLEGWGLNNQLDNLSKLKEDGRAKITIESAITHYKRTVDAETLEPVEFFEKDGNGVWTSVKNEQLSLEVGGEQTIEQDEEITADIVDKFLLIENYEIKGDFEPRKTLAMLSEGYSFDEIATALKFESTTELINKLNEARVEYAAMAKAWSKANEE
ncbi:DNA primase [Ligilactobacillus faecis]|uniref:DNA primase n=1 Tax=Ligilactobacillus faecis TaxID=762833 RepID=UPI002468A5D5|nr:DNA primase [Ligilactobacillus faecis]WGN89793.1 DNA primase [Ligilactobacillus faecis]